MNILVTGARGFIGTRVMRQLADEGHHAVPLEGDVRAHSPRHRVDAVIHLASLISHRGDHSEENLSSVNVEGTRRLLNGYPQSHFVYISTMDVTRKELSDYARSKLEAETLVTKHSSYCIVRLPSVFGPLQRQQSKLIPKLLRHYVLGDPFPQMVDDIRPYVYVDDAAKAVCDGLKQQGIVEVPGVHVSNRDLDRLIATAARAGATGELRADERRLVAQFRECALALREAPRPAS